MSLVPLADRTSTRGVSRSAAQFAAFVAGAWWLANGVGALLIDSNLATGRVHGSGDLLGVSVTANGWHALFHLLPGVIGIAAASRHRAAVAFLLVAGGVYIVVGVGGLVAGGASIGVIAVDESGDLVHLIEGSIVFAAGIVTLRSEHGRVTAPAE